MINILQLPDEAESANPDAVKLFRQQWGLYRKIVEHDYLNHRQAIATLRHALQSQPAGPLRLIDLACGDAFTTLQALHGVPISHYRGIDLSRPALELAASNLATLAASGCEVRLEQRDFSKALQDCPASADLIWLGLSLHHLSNSAKLDLLRGALQTLGSGGELLIYEPVSPDGEDRQGYLRNFRAVGPRWTEGLGVDGWQDALAHVSDNDLPETVASWRQLGLDAGFDAVDTLFLTDDHLCGMFRYSKAQA